MVCRTTSGGRVTTPHVRMLYGWDDSQCTSLFHRLRRWASEQAFQVSAEDYLSAMETLRRETMGMRDVSASARNRALARIDEAQRSPLPSQADAWAAVHMTRYAREAERRLSLERAFIARTNGLSSDFVDAEFKRLRRECPSEARDLSDLPFPLPNDVGTRWAMTVLQTGLRCNSCGRFLGEASEAQHSCPMVSPVRHEYVEPLPDSNATGPAAAALTATVAPALMDMEDFQSLYDAAVARISDGNTRVPELGDLEHVAGGVTAGLAGEGKTTFGLEIEIDFPDDTYPYSARQTLAGILFDEGIAVAPSVSRWHFLGGIGEDRPGGEYVRSNGAWSCEFDRTVDDVEGERGVEIKSQILSDMPDAWSNLRRICEAARELGGRPTTRTGLHVNIGADDFPDDRPEVHLRLLRLFAAFDDTLIRMAHNPESGRRHRGRNFCAPVDSPVGDFSEVISVKRYAGHYHAVNLGHLPDEYTERSESSRVEVRVFDSSLDVGRIQAQTNLSLALLKAAAEGDESGFEARHAGYSRERFGSRRLSGEQWEEATRPYRRLVEILRKQGLSSPQHLAQFFHLFAESRWPYRF
jgi:hypothetical protein